MDIEMPDMDGLQAASLIRRQEHELGRHIPIVAMTAHALPGVREKCLAAGLDGYVGKPVRKNELYRVIAGYFAEARPAAP